MSDAERLISDNRNVVERLRQQAELLHQKRPQLSADSKLLYLGELYPIVCSVRLKGFDGSRFLLPAGTEEEQIQLLGKIYHVLARQFIVPRVQKLAQSFGIDIRNIRINQAVSRWGSCSAKGDLNFSWHLIRCPVELVDSVICHELAHRFELNHSSRFYLQLAKLDPLYREHRAALRRFNRLNPWFR